MSSNSTNEYVPDYVSPPGDTLRELIQARGMTQAELAQRMGRPKKTINEIVRGKAAITTETALQLERVLGAPAGFWNNRERHYREYLALQEERQRLRACVDWLRRFPVKQMVKRGWIQGFKDDVRQIQELLNFFGVASPEQWESTWATRQFAFGKAPGSARGALAAWLRRAEVLGQQADCAPFHPRRFRKALSDIRCLTLLPAEEFQPELRRLCALSGVAVVFVPQLPNTRANGATCWLTSEKALIQLSLRYRWEDVFWFSFFHEAAHILLHGKKEVFVDDGESRGPKEEDANRFAEDKLIPPDRFQTFVGSGTFTRRATILEFAEHVGISPGVVVGRLQYEGLLAYRSFTDLKRRFVWAE